MFWIALLPTCEDEFSAWGWWALQFTPRAARVDEALLLEVSGSERLWGGRKPLLRRLLQSNQALAPVEWGLGATSLIALACLRLKMQGRPQQVPQPPQDLPLDTLTAAIDHVDTLERTGCRTWGDLRALPRGGVARRFGAALLDALDAGFGHRPERYDWLTLPESFDLNFELPALATAAPELMWSAQRLLTQLQVWLAARNRGVLALEFEWTLDLRRLNGVKLPKHEQLVVRTAQATQDIAHLRRLVSEHLNRATLSAPANHLRLRSLETVPWGGISTSLLPEDNIQGEKLHQLVERLSARLGEGNVTVPHLRADHRPENMQAWVPARRGPQAKHLCSDPLYPTWLLARPLELEVRNDQPYHGEAPLKLLARRHRMETGWWEAGGATVRDYCVARSETAGLVWVYCEHLLRRDTQGMILRDERWYLQGIYA